MGIGRICAHLLLENQNQKKQKGKVLQLGRQYILFDHAFLQQCATHYSYPLSSIDNIQLSFNEQLRSKGYIDDTSFFKLLGFEHVDSLDYSPYEQASIIWDLNQPIPEMYWNQYDLIFDGGTAEHVFHLPQFLKNIFLMLKPGGRVIHQSPTHNYVDHGFYMFSPTLYYEYYMANHYNVLRSLILESFMRRKVVNVYPYQPGCLKKLDRGGFGKQVLDVFFVAQKQMNSSYDVIPQQLSNQLIWARESQTTVPTKKKPKSFPSRMWQKTVKPCIKMFFPSTGKMPRKIATYRDI
jgi:hypothetical protein